MLHCSGFSWNVFLNKFATFHDLNAQMSILRHQYLFQMLGICIYDLWERFCVAKINITNFTSKICSTGFSFFVIYLYIHFWLVTKLVQGNLGGTFNPKFRRVLSMKKCIEQVVPRQWSEIHFLGTFLWFRRRPIGLLPYDNWLISSSLWLQPTRAKSCPLTLPDLLAPHKLMQATLMQPSYAMAKHRNSSYPDDWCYADNTEVATLS